MEATKRLFIVSFGNSQEYRLEVDSHLEPKELRHSNPLESVEESIKDFLEKEFPGQSLAYFETPKATEIKWKDREKYAGYPILDDKAIANIKSVLKREVEIRQDNQMLDSDAPYSDVEN